MKHYSVDDSEVKGLVKVERCQTKNQPAPPKGGAGCFVLPEAAPSHADCDSFDHAMGGLVNRLYFIAELDRLKRVLRHTLLLSGERCENSAEHSWHIAMMAIVMEEFAATPVNLERVLKMLLVHDIVEIDAGDTLVYDVAGKQTQKQRETAAASRIFGMLEVPLGTELKGLWEEFDEGASPEAAFAQALDRLQPLLHNYLTQGKKWRENGVDAGMVRRRAATCVKGSPEIGAYMNTLIADAVEKGWLAPEPQVNALAGDAEQS